MFKSFAIRDNVSKRRRDLLEWEQGKRDGKTTVVALLVTNLRCTYGS